MFWRKQFAVRKTRAQVAFDTCFGIALPSLFAFLNTGLIWEEPSIFGSIRLFGSLEVLSLVVCMVLALTVAPSSGYVSGALLAGGLLAAVVGLLCSPILLIGFMLGFEPLDDPPGSSSWIGGLVGLGLAASLLLIPWFTAFACFRNARRLRERADSQEGVGGGTVPLVMLAVLLVPALVQGLFRVAAAQRLELLFTGTLEEARSADVELRRMCKFSSFNVQALVRRGDEFVEPERRELAEALYEHVTGSSYFGAVLWDSL